MPALTPEERRLLELELECAEHNHRVEERSRAFGAAVVVDLGAPPGDLERQVEAACMALEAGMDQADLEAHLERLYSSRRRRAVMQVLDAMVGLARR